MRQINFILFMLLLFLSTAISHIYAGKIEYLQERFARYKKEMKPNEIKIAELFISISKLAKMHSTGNTKTNDLKIIKLYDELYQLSKLEYKKSKQSTLWKLFYIDYVGIPVIISSICTNSNSLSTEQILYWINRQVPRTKDLRVKHIYFRELVKKKSFKYVISQIQNEIKNGNEDMIRVLVEMRIRYQKELIKKALKEKNIEGWEPDIIGHKQMKQAISEIKNHLKKHPEDTINLLGTLENGYSNFLTYQTAHQFYFSLLKGKKYKFNRKTQEYLKEKIEYYKKQEKIYKGNL